METALDVLNNNDNSPKLIYMLIYKLKYKRAPCLLFKLDFFVKKLRIQ